MKHGAFEIKTIRERPRDKNACTAGQITVYKFQLAGKWSESEKISCHAIFKNLYEPKMDVILTISFRVTAEIEIRKRIFCIVLRRRGVSAL